MTRLSMGVPFFLRVLIWAVVLLGAPRSAWSAEKMGVFSFSEMFLTPSATFKSGEDGGFGLTNSWLGFQWTRGDGFYGILKIGTYDLVQPAIWFNPVTNPPAFGLAEVYMRGESTAGDLSVGLLNVEYGFESVFQQWTSVLPESLARRNGWVIKRDYGLKLNWNTYPWQASIAMHNGESSASQDGRFWGTGHWMFSGDGGFRILASAQVGTTKALTTNTSTAATQGFVFDGTEPSKVRMGSVALIHEWQRTLWVLEVTEGQIVQKQTKNSFLNGRIDGIWNFGGDVGLLLRYEHLATDQSKEITQIKASTVGIVVNSKDQLSSLSIYGTHQQENPEIENDTLGLLFRIRSNLF